ncbi:ABC-type nickel/cobalt efflux system permease component RcnA [Paraburkholderia sp. BL18I3N2]|uniref:nickel/cobalt transporter n=1 Tax=Paraburkholderia sp. BL18I3N2 TaxID=1938799 RepID=UPI000D04C0E3|nr:high frequency lysogenization protein HflD [Paraburkholderia sp. BL18I3N2]PRX17498.1 ABC-type nickel/cobalt efflux system permease component RcnA [Paraburkholderia sp. BL18I3N2]
MLKAICRIYAATCAALPIRGAIASMIFLCVAVPVASQAQGIDVFGRPIAASTTAAASPASPQRSVAQHTDANPEGDWIPGPVRHAVLAAVRLQGRWNARIQDMAVRLGTERDPALWVVLLGLSFAYGVLHALGPGHGKLVVGTYLGSRGAHLREAILLSGWTAAVQAASAIVVVMGSILVTREGAQGILARAVSLELVSYVMLCVAGSWTVWSIATRRDCCADGRKVMLVPKNSRIMNDTGDRGDDDRYYLGHRLPAHLRPALRLAAKAKSGGVPKTSAIGSQICLTGLGAGMRPCAGAIFVLVVSVGAHVPEAGISATLAMALGVTVTVTLVGLGASGLNRGVGRLSLRYGPRVAHMQRRVALLGSLAIVAFAALQIALQLGGVLTPSLS